MNLGKCKLCLTDDIELLSNSHIIPNFLHFGLKDEKGKYSLILPDNYIKGRNQHLKHPLGAMYEPDLLCKKCDNEIIGSYEHGLSKTLTENQNNNSYFTFENKKHRIFKNIDYNTFKLGLLSILWRASIANSKMFEQVNISSDHFEELRLMILNNDAKHIEDYPIRLYLLDKDDEKLILNPRYTDEESGESALFYINGYMILFTIGRLKSKHDLPYIPNKSGSIYVQIREKDYLRNYIQNIMVTTKIKLNS